jgi:hypothetical protein
MGHIHIHLADQVLQGKCGSEGWRLASRGSGTNSLTTRGAGSTECRSGAPQKLAPKSSSIAVTESTSHRT